LNLFGNLTACRGRHWERVYALNRNRGIADDRNGNQPAEDGMMITRALLCSILISAFAAGAAGPATAQACTKQGVDVNCDDGRRGIFAGDAIVWADGTRSRLASPHPSVIVGNKSSVTVGPGVFVGKGKGVVPMENPSDPRRARCPVLDGVSYCY
jgi:2-polyprenyl-6-methoxyphenol hydroxylase-like FAD-dependent oxidoreductase